MIARVLEARNSVLALFSLILIGSVWFSLSLSFDPNNRAFFGPGHEHFRNLQELEASFGSNTNLFFVVVSDESLYQSERLSESVRWLSDEVWRINEVVNVESAATYPHVVSSADEVEIFNLLDFVCPDHGSCDPDRAWALRKEHLQNRVVAASEKAFSVVAKVDLTEPRPELVASVAESAESVVRDFRDRFPELAIHLTGGVPMMQAFFDAAQSDSAALLPIVISVLSIGLYVFLGGVVPALLMILLGLSAVVVTLGIAGAFGLVINTATATVPLIVFTLVVAAAMHVFLHIVREERLDSRESLVLAARTAVNANWRPVALTAITTAVGLTSMVFVSAPPLRELGVLAALGVLVGAIFTLTVVPCLFALLPRLKTSNYLFFVQERMNRYAAWVERTEPRWIVWIALACLLLAVAGLSRVSVDEDFVRYFSESTKFRTATEQITEIMAGPYHVDVVYDSSSPAGVFSDETVQDVRRLVSLLRSRSEVVSVTSVLDVLDESAKAFATSPDIAGIGPEERAQLFLTYELSLGVGQSTTGLVDLDHRKARISALLGDVSMGQIRRFVEQISAEADRLGIGDRIVITGEGVPTAYLSSESIREMAVGIVLSVALSVVLVGVYFGSLKACATILAATVIPILAGFGAWGWIASEIGMAATLVVATTIGVVIDDTIHLTYRYLDGVRNLDLTPWGATAYSVHKAGTAIFVTSIVLVAGLLVLIMSDFRMNSTYGICASLIVALALVYNLVIAPRLLSRLR